MRILVKNESILQDLASLCDEYYEILDGLHDMQVEYPIVIVLYQNSKIGLVESDDEFFNEWSTSDDLENYDWNCEDLYDQLWNDYMN